MVDPLASTKAAIDAALAAAQRVSTALETKTTPSTADVQTIVNALTPLTASGNDLDRASTALTQAASAITLLRTQCQKPPAFAPGQAIATGGAGVVLGGIVGWWLGQKGATAAKGKPKSLREIPAGERIVVREPRPMPSRRELEDEDEVEE